MEYEPDYEPDYDTWDEEEGDFRMWDDRRAGCLTSYALRFIKLDQPVYLDNFVLMRQRTLRYFTRLAGEADRGVNVTDVEVPKINSAAALASNVLRRAAEFVYIK